MQNDLVLAIDFGTSNSLVGAWQEGRRVEALPVEPAAADPTLMRTLLYFPTSDVCHYGQEAVRRYVENDLEGRLFRSFKSHLPNRSYLGTFMDDRALTLENMIGIFLLEIKRRAERILNSETETAVIGRPARYSLDPAADNFALHRMQKAAEFAGFKKIEFVPEPLAAALDLRREIKTERLALIGDFGGGTSDFTLIKLGPFEFKKEHVLGLDGCPLAGDALDALFMSERLSAHFGAKAEYKMELGRNRLSMPPAIIDRLNKPAHIVHLKDPATYEFIKQARKGAMTPKDRAALDRLFALIDDQQIFTLFEEIEATKRRLSDNERTEMRYSPLDILETFTRAEFDNWANNTREKIFASLDRCLTQAGTSAEQVDLVCMTGGSAKVPLIREALETRFGRDKMRTQAHFHSVLSGLIESAGQFH